MAINFKSENVVKHKDLSDKIKDTLQVNGNVINEKETHASYYSNLPEGITKKEVEELAKYNSKFITSAHVAVGELGAEIFAGDSSINQVEAQVGFFGKNDHINMSILRDKTYKNNLAGDENNKEVTKHLVIKTTVTSQSVEGYGLKAVRESMSEEFKDMFKS